MKSTKISALVFIASLAAVPQALFSKESNPDYVLQKGAELSPDARLAVEQIVAKDVPSFAIAFGQNGRAISQIHSRDISMTTQYPIASASKWLTAALVMTLVDEGKVSLDAPVSTWLPNVNPSTGKVTLRQLLSQTSGVAGTLAELYDMKQDHRMTLSESAAEILGRPLDTTPGSNFVYGAPGFQVAGAVVEAVTGQTWEEAFQQRLAQPLGMTNTHWLHLTFEKVPPLAETRNPLLQGGAVSTASDYMQFLSMLSQKGKLGSRRILSQKAVHEMLKHQTLQATFAKPDPFLGDARYSLGNWCEAWDRKANCTQSSSLGAFGTYPWLIQKTGRYGIVFVNLRENPFRILPEIRALQAAISKPKR